MYNHYSDKDIKGIIKVSENRRKRHGNKEWWRGNSKRKNFEKEGKKN